MNKKLIIFIVIAVGVVSLFLFKTGTSKQAEQSTENSENLSSEERTETTSESITENFSSEERTEAMREPITDNIVAKSYPEIDNEGNYYSSGNPFDIVNAEHKKDLVFYFDTYDLSDYAYYYTHENYEKMERDLFYLQYRIPDDCSVVKQNSEFGFKLHENNKLEIIKYYGNETDVNIPEKINGFTVAYIGKEAFAEEKIESVYMPDTVIFIDDLAFANCKNLKNVRLSENLIALLGSFSGCSGLKEIKLPNALEYIYAGAFQNSGICHIEFPPNLKIIEKDAFLESSDLSGVEFNNGLLYIGECAFGYTGLKQVALPATLSELSNAFYYCKQLDTVRFPKHMVKDFKIEEHTFEQCSNLRQIEFPDNLTEIQDSAFEGCRSLEKVYMPTSLNSVGAYAFSLSGLKEVYFRTPNCYFGPGAFANCYGLKIYAPKSGTIEKFCRESLLLRFVNWNK